MADMCSDADFANGVSLKSVLRMYGNCVFCRSKRQGIIAGDTTEAELIAMSSAANELTRIKQLCTDVSITTKKPTLQGGNKSVNLLAENPVSSNRLKHIRVRHLRVTEYVEHDEMDVQWVGTKKMLADGFTKMLPAPTLSDLKDKLHLVGKCCDICELYACMAGCADAMADAWEDTIGCIQADCLHATVLKCDSTNMWGLHGIVHIGSEESAVLMRDVPHLLYMCNSGRRGEDALYAD